MGQVQPPACICVAYKLPVVFTFLNGKKKIKRICCDTWELCNSYVEFYGDTAIPCPSVYLLSRTAFILQGWAEQIQHRPANHKASSIYSAALERKHLPNPSLRKVHVAEALCVRGWEEKEARGEASTQARARICIYILRVTGKPLKNFK